MASSNPNCPRAILALTLFVGLLAAGCPSPRSDGNPGGSTPPPSPKVQAPNRARINVMQTAGVKWIKVTPMALGVCKYSARCDDEFELELEPNPPIQDTDRIVVKTAQSSSTPPCLDPQPPYELSRASPSVTVAIDPNPSSCPDGTKAAWLYDVVCVDDKGGDCDIKPADPGVIIEGTPGG